MTPNERKLRRAAMAARRFIARGRLNVIECHSNPPGSSDVNDVKDKRGLRWIADHDNVLRKIDLALGTKTKGTKKP